MSEGMEFFVSSIASSTTSTPFRRIFFNKHEDLSTSDTTWCFGQPAIPHAGLVVGTTKDNWVSLGSWNRVRTGPMALSMKATISSLLRWYMTSGRESSGTSAGTRHIQYDSSRGHFRRTSRCCPMLSQHCRERIVSWLQGSVSGCGYSDFVRSDTVFSWGAWVPWISSGAIGYVELNSSLCNTGMWDSLSIARRRLSGMFNLRWYHLSAVEVISCTIPASKAGSMYAGMDMSRERYAFSDRFNQHSREDFHMFLRQDPRMENLDHRRGVPVATLLHGLQIWHSSKGACRGFGWTNSSSGKHRKNICAHNSMGSLPCGDSASLRRRSRVSVRESRSTCIRLRCLMRSARDIWSPSRSRLSFVIWAFKVHDPARPTASRPRPCCKEGLGLSSFSWRAEALDMAQFPLTACSIELAPISMSLMPSVIIETTSWTWTVSSPSAEISRRDVGCITSRCSFYLGHDRH